MPTMAKMLSYDDFLLSLKLCPRITVELVVVDGNKRVCLLLRDKEPFVGKYHLPGGFLLKDEKIDSCVKRIAQKELEVKIEKYQFLGVFETPKGDPRGHIVHYVVKTKNSAVKIDNSKYFKAIPKNIIPYQRKILKNINNQP